MIFSISLETDRNDFEARRPLLQNDSVLIVAEDDFIHPLTAPEADRFAARQFGDCIERGNEVLRDFYIIRLGHGSGRRTGRLPSDGRIFPLQ